MVLETGEHLSCEMQFVAQVALPSQESLLEQVGLLATSLRSEAAYKRTQEMGQEARK